MNSSATMWGCPRLDKTLFRTLLRAINMNEKQSINRQDKRRQEKTAHVQSITKRTTYQPLSAYTRFGLLPWCAWCCALVHTHQVADSETLGRFGCMGSVFRSFHS
jgi:hypothetical protein